MRYNIFIVYDERKYFLTEVKFVSAKKQNKNFRAKQNWYSKNGDRKSVV